MELKRCTECDAEGSRVLRDQLGCEACDGIGWIVPADLAEEPTTFGPGSDGKLAVLCLRYRRGKPLWWDEDETLCRVKSPRSGNPGGI